MVPTTGFPEANISVYAFALYKEAHHDSSQASGAAASCRRFPAYLVDGGAREPDLDAGVAEKGGVLRDERALDFSEHFSEVGRRQGRQRRYGRRPGDELWDKPVGDVSGPRV